MKPSLFVSAVRSNINLPKTKLEGFANKYKKNCLGDRVVSNLDLPGYENIVWKFLKARIRGTVQMILTGKQNDSAICLVIPATADFFVACTKGQNKDFEFAFGISLS